MKNGMSHGMSNTGRTQGSPLRGSEIRNVGREPCVRTLYLQKTRVSNPGCSSERLIMEIQFERTKLDDNFDEARNLFRGS